MTNNFSEPMFAFMQRVSQFGPMTHIYYYTLSRPVFFAALLHMKGWPLCNKYYSSTYKPK